VRILTFSELWQNRSKKWLKTGLAGHQMLLRSKKRDFWAIFFISLSISGLRQFWRFFENALPTGDFQSNGFRTHGQWNSTRRAVVSESLSIG